MVDLLRSNRNTTDNIMLAKTTHIKLNINHITIHIKDNLNTRHINSKSATHKISNVIHIIRNEQFHRIVSTNNTEPMMVTHKI